MMMSDWISVDDGLPEKDDEYLIYPEPKYNGMIAYFWACDSYDGHIKGTFEHESKYGEITQLDYVTHWMPLPEPPTKQQDPIYKGYRIFKDTVSNSYRIMMCEDNIAQDFDTVDLAKEFIDELIEVNGD